MCGLVGYIDLRGERKADGEVLLKMANALVHRGPDSYGFAIADSIGLGFRRLSIIDLEGGDQPLYNEDGSVVVVCNGELYNYRQLRADLKDKGHTFKTNCDVEVLPHLHEEMGVDLLNELNGQFAFALYDKRERRLILARDHCGVNPLFYMISDDVLIFASEIKAILEHPLARPEVDLTGLDQVLTLPGLVSPRTAFKGVESLKSGHYISVKDGDVSVREYWDLDYPKVAEASYDKPEAYYVNNVGDLLTEAVMYRLQSDVPVGFYLSGGLDSSLIAAIIKRVLPSSRMHSFSVGFQDRAISEIRYQNLMASEVNSVHHQIMIGESEIADRLSDMIYHCECPVKETYNTCSMALSEAAKRNGITVILTGEGADELFAGYVGYRLDSIRPRNEDRLDYEIVFEEELRERVYGDKEIFYESGLYALREIKETLYSSRLVERLEDFDCLSHDLINKERLKGRHFIHQRSYLDFKLRMSDHLISDHGDRMALANSVEARYPFLDIALIEFMMRVPPDLKLNQRTDKYILRKLAESLVPREIAQREKFGFQAPGSAALLQHNIEWINDLLSYDRITRQGYFNADAVENLKRQYSRKGFKLNLPFDSDLLMIVLTFGILLDRFKLPELT